MESEFVKPLALTQSAVEAHPLKKKVIVGVFINKGKVLLAKKFNHQSLYLPGGTVEVTQDGLMQIQIEKMQLAKFIFEKTQCNIFPVRPIVEVCKNDGISIPIRAYLMTDKRIFTNSLFEEWKNNKQFQPIWLSQVKTNSHPYLPEAIKKILTYFLANQEAFTEGPHYINLPIEVLTIAN